MLNVRQLLETKGTEVWSIGPQASVYEAIVMMAERGVGALPVMRGDEMLGIISERDYARKIILQGRASRETLVEQIMSAPVITVTPNQDVNECMGRMTSSRIRHLPVVEDGRVIGMLSIGDLVKAVIQEQQHQIETLERFISG